MSFDYGQMIDVANELVGEFGTTAVIMRNSGIPDPSRPWEGSGPELDIAYPCKIVIGSYRGIELASDGISLNDAKIMISREGLQITPNTGDAIQLTGEDRAFEISSVKSVMPGGIIIYWEVQAK